MQTIYATSYYAGYDQVSRWSATSNNPPQGKSSYVDGDGYAYSPEEVTLYARQITGYFNPQPEDTIYVNGEMYQAGRQSTPTPIPMCPARTPYYEIQASRGLCVFPAEPPIPLEEEYPDAFRPPTVEPPYKPPIAGDLCPRGNTYPAAIGAKIWGCDEGYDWIPAPVTDFFNTGDCVCSTYAQTPEGQRAIEEEKEEGLSMGLGSIIKMLPQLLIVMVIVSIIGAFRK